VSKSEGPAFPLEGKGRSRFGPLALPIYGFLLLATPGLQATATPAAPASPAAQEALQAIQQDQNFGPLSPKSLPSTSNPPPPADGPVPAAEGDDTVLSSALHGVVIVTAPSEVATSGAATLKLTDKDGRIRFPSSIAEADRKGLRAAIEPYLDQPVSILAINEMLRDIVRYYRGQDRPIVDAYLPAQDMEDSILQIVITESRRGPVQVEGNNWFASSFFSDQIRTGEGSPIKASTMNHDVGWINRNPFLQTDLLYAAGADQGTTDIVLKVRDRFPVRFYTSYDDSGNSLTGYDRYTEGFNWGNVFGIGDQFNYQFMSDSRFDLLKAHSASYIHDFSWHHSLTVFGSYADTKANFPPGIPYSSSGSSWQTSLRYTIPVADIPFGFGIYNHEIVLGYDFKESNSQLLFNQLPVPGESPTTDVSQFTAGYNASLPDPYGATAFTSNVFYSPGGMTQADSHDVFVEADASSDSYTYIKLGLSRVTKLPWNFSLIDKFTYQKAWARLIGSEQLGIGGYDTVRGYDDREANGDDGYIASNEIRAPSFSLGQFFAKGYTGDQMQLLAFVDYAGVSQYRPDDLSLAATPSTNPNVNLLGVGPGFRYTLAPYLTVRFDYGWQMIDSGVSPLFRSGNSSRGSLGVTLSY